MWLPFHSSLRGLSTLAADEPQRGAVVVRAGHPLAPGIEGEAGHRGRVWQFLQFLAGLVEQVDGLPDGAGQQALALLARVACDCSTHFERKSAMSDTVPSAAMRRNFPSSPPEMKLHRGRGIGREGEDRAVVRFGCAPGLAVGDATRRIVPSPRAKAAVVPARSKLAATTNASRSRWVPRELEQKLGSGIRSSVGAPSPQPPPARGGGVDPGNPSTAPSPCGRGLGGGGHASHRITQPRIPRTRAAAAAGLGCAR